MTIETIQFIILIPAATLSLIAGIVLILKGRKKFDKGMISLGFSYIMMICLFVIWGFRLVPLFVNYTIMLFTYSGMNFFTKFTFHKNQNRGFKWVMIGTVFNYFIQVIPAIRGYYNYDEGFFDSYLGRALDNTFSITWAVIVFGWLAFSGIRSYNQIKNKKIQPWIKKRLLLVIYSAIINMFVNVPNLIDELTNRIYHKYVFYIQMIMLVSIMVMQFLAWVMPKGLKKLFNHGYIKNKNETELTEEEIINQMKERVENK